MKSKSLTVTTLPLDPFIEARINAEHDALKRLVTSNAKHFARRNLPAAKGDALKPYTDEINAGCLRLKAEIEKHYQADAARYDAKVDAASFQERNKIIDGRIATLTDEVNNDKHELERLPPLADNHLKTWAWIVGGCIAIGEIFFNSKAFQVLGDNLITVLLTSLGATAAILGLPFLAAKLYKQTKSTTRRKLIVAGSLLLAVAMFAGLAVMRSTYLEMHQVSVSPIFFLIVNVFMFIVSALLSYFILPDADQEELRNQRRKLEEDIAAKDKSIKELAHRKEELVVIVAEHLKYHNRITEQQKHYIEVCLRMEAELLAMFKRINLAFRTDRLTPDCFIIAVVNGDDYSYQYSTYNLI